MQNHITKPIRPAQGENWSKLGDVAAKVIRDLAEKRNAK